MKRYFLIILATLALTFCVPAQSEAEDIIIGAAGAMTGTDAAFGEQMRAGAEAAIADINAAGGLLGKKLRLEIGDDVCDPKQGRLVAEKFAAMKVSLVVGHFCSGSSIPASEVYNEEGIVEISPAATNPAYTDNRPGPYIFRLCGRDDMQGQVAGGYLARAFAGKRVAIAHDKSSYGKGLADETLKAYRASGQHEVLYDTITKGERDFSALVSKLKQVEADVLFYGGNYNEAGLIVRQMREQGLKTVFMGGDGLMTQDLWQITGDTGEGMLMTFPPDPRKLPSAAQLVKRFRERNVEPEGYILYTYAAIQTWKQAVEKAKSFAGKDVIKVMATDEFDTAIGKFRFDSKGDPNLPAFAIYRWSKGNYAQLD